jgi:uncharacterized protein (DUF58 family)
MSQLENLPVSLPKEIFAEIRRLHFQTRRLASEGLSGTYKSAFKGRGIEFEEVREYVPGDDVRAIDWKVTARSRSTFIKNYREERELTVMIVLDISGSTMTGTRRQLKESLIARLGAVLALTAVRNNDKVGLVTFSDRTASFHPPRKARSAVWRILHEVLTPQAAHGGTNFPAVLSLLRRVLRRSSVVFLISDFVAPPFERELSMLAKRHDVNAFIITDPADTALPDGGLVTFSDPETGAVRTIDTSNTAVRREFERQSVLRRKEILSMFMRQGVDHLELSTNVPFSRNLRQFFDSKSAKREARQVQSGRR